MAQEELQRSVEMSSCPKVNSDKIWEICDPSKKMMYEVQYDFFLTPEESEVERLVRIVDEIRISSTKVRKGTYAAIGELKKRIIDLEETLGILVKNICEAK